MTPTVTPEIAAGLREAAEKAPEGPYKLEFNEKSGSFCIYGKRRDGNVRQSDGLGELFIVEAHTWADADKHSYPDIEPEIAALATLVALANPQTILALLDGYEALKREGDEAQTNLGIATATMVAQEAALRASEAERDQWRGAVQRAEHRLSEADHLITDMVAERERMRVALTPFVAHYEAWMDKHDDETLSSTFPRHTFGQLRRARATLTKEPENAGC